MTDDEMKERLRATGSRFRAADRDRSRALADLKHALADADGSSNPEEASELTGLSPSAAGFLLDPDGGSDADPQDEE